MSGTCTARKVVQGVILTCDKQAQHTVHHDPCWGIVWGKNVDRRPTVPAPRKASGGVCPLEGCTLKARHKGPCGEQMAIEL